MKRLIPALLFLALVGCKTPPDEQIVPFTQNQTQALFTRSRPPQAFGLTVYSTEMGPLFAGAHRVHPGQTAVMPFINRADPRAIEINLTARGIKEIPTLIDTASRENWVTAPLAVSMNSVSLAGPNPYHTTAVHVYDEIGGYASLMHRLTIDKLHVENVLLYIRAASGPLGVPARWLQDPTPQLALGAPFLRAFSYVTVDFAQRSVVFSATTPFQKPEATLIAQAPLVDVRGVIGVEGTLNGEPTTFVVDTGGDFDLALNDPAGLTVRRVTAGDLVFPLDVRAVAAREIGLGEVEYPRIGRGLLSRYRVTLDFRNKTLYFERPTR
ncbi:MAG: hypothetical protein H3C50_05065 [Kiritimatiellae bacterium]|nr:hypothetical protein [Kiritimatiellia bacterium]MCO5068084.1 hypothetical protein [Kiritimatiellia bacterium]